MEQKQTETTASRRPPAPHIAGHIQIGLNSVTRSLEGTATQCTPILLADRMCHLQDSIAPGSRATPAIVILSKTKSDLMYSHLPVLCATASADFTEGNSIRLVSLDVDAETRLAECTGLHRVGVIGVSAGDAAVQPLIDYVRSHVEPVHLPWLVDALQGRYQPLKIESTMSKPKEHRATRNAMA